MPTMKVKDAQAKWKKVKPLLLTKTGVSEKLGALNSYDRKNVGPKDIDKWKKTFNDVLKFTHAKEKDQKIKKHSKCVKFLQDLGTALAEENTALNLLDAKTKEVERQEKQAAVWIKTLNESLKDLAKLKQKGLKLQTQIKQAESKLATLDPATFDKVQKGLSAEFFTVQMERKGSKPKWYPLQKEIQASKHKDACKLLNEVIKQDAELRQDSGGLEKDLLEGIKKLEQEYKQLQLARAKDVKQWTKTLQAAAKTLVTATKAAEGVLDEIDKALEGDAEAAAKKHGGLQARANKVQEIRRNTKNTWFSLQQPVADSGDSTAIALLKQVVELDRKLREDSGGLELSMKELLPRLLKMTPAPKTKVSSKSIAALKKHLGISYPDTDSKKLKAAYRKWVLKNHPDKGGNTNDFQEATAAYEEAMEVLG